MIYITKRSKPDIYYFNRRIISSTDYCPSCNYNNISFKLSSDDDGATKKCTRCGMYIGLVTLSFRHNDKNISITNSFTMINEIFYNFDLEINDEYPYLNMDQVESLMVFS